MNSTYLSIFMVLRTPSFSFSVGDFAAFKRGWPKNLISGKKVKNVTLFVMFYVLKPIFFFTLIYTADVLAVAYNGYNSRKGDFHFWMLLYADVQSRSNYSPLQDINLFFYHRPDLSQEQLELFRWARNAPNFFYVPLMWFEFRLYFVAFWWRHRISSGSSPQ